MTFIQLIEICQILREAQLVGLTSNITCAGGLRSFWSSQVELKGQASGSYAR